METKKILLIATIIAFTVFILTLVASWYTANWFINTLPYNDENLMIQAYVFFQSDMSRVIMIAEFIIALSCLLTYISEN